MNAIDTAVNHYRALLESQIERSKRMQDAAPAKDFTKLESATIGVIDGDGIGPIITRASMRVLEALLKDEIAKGSLALKPIEGLTLENRLARGEAIPKDILAEIKTCDVVLKGPTETPKGGTMESANVAMRRELDLYANVRPVSIPREGIDWIFFRENTEGEYVLGSQGIEIPDTLTMDFKVTTIPGTKRIARAAFEYARNNGKHYVAIVTKANIMKKTDGMFSALCHEIAAEYPDIEVEDWYIDIMTAKLVDENIRRRFQVFVLPNLYGDIITDEAAQIQGGVGTAGSANIGDQYAMFEAIHGSAPRMIETGRGAFANPSSLLRAASMMLRHIARYDKADALDAALNAVPHNGDTAVGFADRLIAAIEG